MIDLYIIKNEAVSKASFFNIAPKSPKGDFLII
jgi:hypothetical protein